MKVILKSRNSLLYLNGESWTKKGGRTFDVTMGSFYGAEICDLVGLFILSKLQALGIIIGLFRDDGLAVSNRTARQNDMLQKEICRVFRSVNLSITILANQNEVHFLDITMDMKNGSYKPFIKQNDEPEYVNKLSNHPPEVLKNIPIGINKRLVNISANKEVFEAATDIYQNELTKCGYAHHLVYEDTNNNNISQATRRSRQRSRRITWLNPPFSRNVATNIGQKFLKIIDEKIPDELKRYFNRNTIKMSYRCMPNVKNHIDRHNAKLLNQDKNNNNTVEKCNCQAARKQDCPLLGNVLLRMLCIKQQLRGLMTDQLRPTLESLLPSRGGTTSTPQTSGNQGTRRPPS